MGVVLMMVVGMSSCSSDDDDYNYVQYTVGTVPTVFCPSDYIE